MSIEQGDLLWTPSESFKRDANVSKFMAWLEFRQKRSFDSYDDLWRWSVENVAMFWEAVWDFSEVQSDTDYHYVLSDGQMPDVDWFRGSRLNFAEHLLRNERPDATAIHAYSELNKPRHISWEDLGGQVRILAQQLRTMGVQPGDRVACYLPNVPEAVVALLASTSIGAIFSSCSPDFGYNSVIDRFSQIEPAVLFCVDGYRFAGKDFDRRQEVKEIIHALPTVKYVIQLQYLFREDHRAIVPGALLWRDIMAQAPVPRSAFKYERLPFEHPLWVVYSSGTTGLPKPIVHGHGGITLEFFKLLGFHMNQKPDSAMFFYTTTGWVMWNIVIGALIKGGAIVLYDGSPVGEDPATLWRLAEDSGTTFFGASPTYITLMEQLGVKPQEQFDLSRIEGILLGGSPVTPEAMQWCYENVKKDLWVTSQSGGTDICSAFVGASPTLPVYAGEIQARCLGVDAKAYNDAGEPVTNEVGELVICQPMPSMPIYFWNDPGKSRYRSSYFEDFAGVWRHGDYFLVNERGGCFIYGRSDSTLNRYGVRIGTAEIYRTVEQLEEVADSLIVNLDLPGGKFFMPLFVSLKDDLVIDNELCNKISTTLRRQYSPRHVPDQIIQVSAIPYTLTNKKMEVPVRKILLGTNPAKAANRDAMANPDALDFFVNYARTTRDYTCDQG